MRIKSPGYPNVNLRQAVDAVDRLFKKNRRNVIDREAATKDIGYSGLTGASAKMLSNLGHFGLIEKAGKGGLRVTELAVKLLAPNSDGEKQAALLEAAYAPELYAAIKGRWPDGFVSENALTSYLEREGFSPAAVHPAVTSYLETYAFLQQESATESHGAPARPTDNAAQKQPEGVSPPRSHRADDHRLAVSPTPPQRGSGVQAMMDGERELTTGLLSKGAGFRLIVHGKIGEKEIDRLIRKLQLDKEILADSDESEAFDSED